jgi:ribose 5-phosphate isomerase B
MRRGYRYHGGFGLKEELIAKLRAVGHKVTGFGAHSLNPKDDYPYFIAPLAEAVISSKVKRRGAICGSGSVHPFIANKVKGVRAALIHDHFSARQGVEATI